MPDELHFLSIYELSEKLASREISPVELTRHFLHRAERLDPPSFDLPAEPRREPGSQLASMITIARK